LVAVWIVHKARAHGRGTPRRQDQARDADDHPEYPYGHEQIGPSEKRRPHKDRAAGGRQLNAADLGAGT
jgi:hypothetical protein